MNEHRPYKVFIVDDDNKHLVMMEQKLPENFNYTVNVETFTNGKDCVAKLDENPDVIILDYYFSNNENNVETGIDVLKQIKQKKDDIPVIMMSHQDKLEIAIACYDYGATDYVIKNDSAVLRTQLILKNIFQQIHAEELNLLIKEGARKTSILLGIFIVLLTIAILIVVFR
ncbi:MAG: response regulator [Chitinophagaceae bacterium]|nr:MAG: response regulator [Chitinophagaceae bacterium]